MLGFVTVIIMVVVAYAYLREGIFTSFVMCVNVVLAGVLAFNFFEPLAEGLGPMLAPTFVAGFEDAICLVGIFCIALGALRWATNSLAPTEIEFPAIVLRGGSILFGLMTGYLVSGFLTCVLQTLPAHQHFLNFYATVDKSDPSDNFRRVLPPDRVWLGMMNKAGLGVFSNGQDDKGEEITFDPNGSFELRYERYRRFNDKGDVLPDDGFCAP